MIEDTLADLGYTSFDCAATSEEALAPADLKQAVGQALSGAPAP